MTETVLLCGNFAIAVNSDVHKATTPKAKAKATTPQAKAKA